jgi:hypothetical protein
VDTVAAATELPPNPEFSVLASDERIEATAAALGSHGFEALVVGSGAEARAAVLDQIPEGAEVFNNTSVTLQTIGVAADVERSGRYRPVRLQLYQMDREMQKREMRQIAAAPDWVVGSAHAVTEDGSVLVASASGSQLGPIVSGAGRVILVVGGQKVVPDLSSGLRRIHEYSLRLEDARARLAYGVPSGVNTILVIDRVLARGRLTVVLVRQVLGF